MLINFGSNIYPCCNVPFGSALDMHPFGRSGSIGIFQLLYARMESELSLRLHGKTIDFDTLVILYRYVMNIVIADVMCYL